MLGRIKGVVWLLLSLLVWLSCRTPALAAEGVKPPPRKVLAVMSYEIDNSWTVQEREGIDQALFDYEVRYFYLNTKADHAGGWARARAALAVLEEFGPAVVIAADDNAQEMFVVPHLKGRSALPVVFCGVNDEAGKYGYPAANITGVVEVKHYLQTISFARLIINDLRKLAVIYRENSSNAVNVAQIRREMAQYPVAVVDILRVTSLAETLEVVKQLKGRVEAVMVLNLSGLLDDQGRPIDSALAIGELRRVGLPILATEDYAIAAGALCGVVQSGRDQGFRAGQLVREILAGRRPGEIPVEKNLNGQRYLNLTTARQLNLPLGREVLLGSKLLR